MCVSCHVYTCVSVKAEPIHLTRVVPLHVSEHVCFLIHVGIYVHRC